MTYQPGKWSLSGHQAIYSPKWCEQANMRLQAGYGVEDVALWLDCHVSRVRNYVKLLRKAGKLAEWWPVC